MMRIIFIFVTIASTILLMNVGMTKKHHKRHKHHICGVMETPLQTSNRIAGGFNATDNKQFPWQAKLYMNFTMDQGKLSDSCCGESFLDECGAVLIDSQFLLTAAHCVVEINYRVSDLYGYLNAFKIDPASLASKKNIIGFGASSNSIVVHPKYNASNPFAGYDIAIIKLNRTIPRRISRICLPTNNHLRKLNTTNCYISGYGYTDNGDETVSDIIKYLVVELLDDAECVEITNTPYDTDFIPKMDVCSRSYNVGWSQCPGDSGRALQCQSEGKDGTIRWVLIGLDAYGYGACGQTLFPNVGTKVEYHLEWIIKQMKRFKSLKSN